MNVPIAYWPGKKNSKLESWKSSGTIRWRPFLGDCYQHRSVFNFYEDFVLVEYHEVGYSLQHR